MNDGSGPLRSVRVRTTLAASSVVGLALVFASMALLVFLGRSLTANVHDVTLTRAEDVAVALAIGDAPDLDMGESEDEFVQVLSPDGRVLDSSSNVIGEPALALLPPGGEIHLSDAPLEGHTFLAVAVAASAPDGPRIVLVGRSLDDVGEATSATVPLLVFGVPVLVLVVAWVTWWITGRALRPVEAIREEVETISAGRLDRRVPEPATGDEIARLAATMNRMLSRLQASQARQRRFVSDAAHELRSPVASIRQHSELAITHPRQAKVGELAQVVHQENLRVERLVDDLLLLARMDEGDGEMVEEVDLDDLVLAEATRLRASTPLRVETHGVSAARSVGNPSELGRVVRNLADNAARHAHGVVALSLIDVAGRAVLSVDDDGPGIDAADRERVFDRFVRLDAARARNDGGAGLGLAIVRAVVEAHGGEVSLGESPLGGARVEVSLPSAPA
ncbi:MAG: ATP-binding protein [Actinomycetota bacterium]|nr:ATP-binding protein [Actinomycetota bacterium]MDH5223795.1 ATP-binding protein [Actinomycetota bacterium]MDH5313092.1 ATP-binding protein [Actinomycetota bacterium]